MDSGDYTSHQITGTPYEVNALLVTLSCSYCLILHVLLMILIHPFHLYSLHKYLSLFYMSFCRPLCSNEKEWNALRSATLAGLPYYIFWGVGAGVSF